eukprot:TRINITY_DN17181_c0_g1_i1.p1 TRINITY_DN17181_c0_g1~~TRINITY_DN17181_c0_g1_i1.p1  ORF type:complete len:353 (+),score=70.47 TRINITY_DN17181_c0_g1_i1:311-1369(+)
MSAYDEGQLTPEDAWHINYDDMIIESVIGHGNFGEVYKADYFGTEVAVKRILEFQDADEYGVDMEKYIEREVANLKGMRHPNIVLFIGVSRTEQGVHIITEYVPRGDLRKVIKNPEIKLDWISKIKMAIDVSRAMAYLHSRKIVFRDMKSKNLLVTDDWRIKMCDFGFARVTSGAASRPMTMCGTEEWMAPEVLMGTAYDFKADVFSYGIVLFEIVARAKGGDLDRTPLDGFAVKESKVRSLCPRDTPAELVDLILKCTKIDPVQRPSFPIIVQAQTAILKMLQAGVAPQKAAASPHPTNRTPMAPSGAHRGPRAPQRTNSSSNNNSNNNSGSGLDNEFQNLKLRPTGRNMP